MTEHFVDSKRDVDNQLKKTCEEFIHYVTTTFVGPLRDFLQKVSNRPTNPNIQINIGVCVGGGGGGGENGDKDNVKKR